MTEIKSRVAFHPYFRIFASSILIFLLFFSAGCASPSLSERPGKPSFRPTGVWITEDSSGAIVLLRITNQDEERHPYRFVWFRYHFRDLPLSGPLLSFSQRKGFVDTSANQMLLVQEEFVRYEMEGNDGETWPVQDPGDFRPPRIERRLLGGGPVTLLKYDHVNFELDDGDYRWRRSGEDGSEKEENGVVIVADGKRALGVFFDSDMVKSEKSSGRKVRQSGISGTVESCIPELCLLISTKGEWSVGPVEIGH